MGKLDLHYIAAFGGKGCGAAFKIELPAAQEGVVIAETPDARLLIKHPACPDPTGARIILAECMTVHHPQPGQTGLVRYAG